MSSNAYIVYIVANRPYATATYNSYALFCETCYTVMLIMLYIFSDATPEMQMKIGGGVALIVTMVSLILSNMILNVTQMYYGRDAIRRDKHEQMKQRAMREKIAEEEAEEVRLQLKKEEEEFTRLPDESSLGGPPSKDKKTDDFDPPTTNHKKQKTMDDSVEEGLLEKRRGKDDDLLYSGKKNGKEDWFSR